MSAEPRAPGAPWTAAPFIALLDELHPRLMGQLDRDPDSPTYGSADRGFWMYRLHDFDSGVLQQAPLHLSGLVALARTGALDACRWLDPAAAPWWRELAEAVAMRTAGLMQRSGFVDEYYPGERSYPATVFAGYATLRAARDLGLDRVLEAPGLRRLAETLLDRPPGAAANQDAAGAAYLWLYSATTEWERSRARAQVDRLLAGPDGAARFGEYGGMDLGYATVSLNYLACLLHDGCESAGPLLDRLADRIGRCVTPSGRLGGEFASRSTTYVLPYGILAALRRAGPGPGAAALAALDPAESARRLDDRYLGHYWAPSAALAAVSLASEGAPALPGVDWLSEADGSDGGIVVSRNAGSAVLVGRDKGGTLQVDSGDQVAIDAGYRLRRSGRAWATCVVSDGGRSTVTTAGGVTVVEVRAPFLRYRTLVASPLKTIVLRVLRVLGPRFNQLFKARLITAPEALPGVTLHRRVWIGVDRVEVHDTVSGLEPGDELATSPAGSMRVVPSARFYQAGEWAAGRGEPVEVRGGSASRSVTYTRAHG